jgi:hypothetical protein
MSDREKRGPGRPKRPRVDRPGSRDAHTSQALGVAPVNQSTPSTSTRSVEQRHTVSTEPSASRASPQKPNDRTEFQSAGQSAPPGKVAIPSLPPRHSGESSRSSKKGRIQRACDFCRKAKAGCSGAIPCSRCKNAGVECVYGDGKRDTDRKYVLDFDYVDRSLIFCRRMARLSIETVSLTRQQSGVAEALKTIRKNSSLTKEEMRAALDDVLAMVSWYTLQISTSVDRCVDSGLDIRT